MTESSFVKAQSDNLPNLRTGGKIDALMMSTYYTSNPDCTSAELRGVKTARYSRKSYKRSKQRTHDDLSPRDVINLEGTDGSPRSDMLSADTPGCSCDLDPEAEIANILHKKCPVITLAQQQLQKLLDETDKLLCDNTRCCRSIYDFLCICKMFLGEDKCRCVLLGLILCSFVTGILFGAASCGSHLGRFNSPLLTCVDNYFVPSSYPSVEESYRSIV